MTEAARPAFYALRSGGWRDYWTLLHAPYTAWHLSFVAVGAAIAPTLSVTWLLESLAAFLLAMGVSAHALDELHGRPLRTRIPSRTLWLMAGVGLLGAVALGIHGMYVVSPWLGLFIATGAFMVVAYNLELFEGRFHSTPWFALAWGAFPALTGYFAQTGSLTASAVLIAGSCGVLAVAQRRLSTPVREVRRQTKMVRGVIVRRDGTSEEISSKTLTAPAEGALRAMSAAMPLLAAALVASHLV
ncbi:MAG: hypothetical protein OEM67_00750 [Thermoleophilia bacterium]|nr:hypothetical protein [Thermoleophilia bacterium]MDH3725126.1 hypothetical protein [Thermoleophilia bacterium]